MQDAAAQDHRNCGFQHKKNALAAHFPQGKNIYNSNHGELFAQAELPGALSWKAAGLTDTIPIIFHIILNTQQINQLGGDAGIQLRIASQLKAINEDFTGVNSDSTGIPAAFKPVFAHTGIHFGLAHQKPDGTATPGYEIIPISSLSSDTSGIEAGTYYNFPGAYYNANLTPISYSSDKYLNIWVINPQENHANTGLLGITTPPSFVNAGWASANETGVLLNYGAFGVRTAPTQYYIPGITGGRTLTHELGHFFELAHVWGENDLCPSDPGGDDDNIADTPPQADATYGNPSFPRYDGCSSSGTNGIMFLNYMDYVNDNAMHMFTNGQANVMNNALATESGTLLTHPWILQYPTSIATQQHRLQLNIYPTPSKGVITLSFPETESKTPSVLVTNLQGQKLDISLHPSGNKMDYTLDLSGYQTGVYFVHCTFESGTLTKKVLLEK